MTPTTPRVVPRDGLPVRCRPCRRGRQIAGGHRARRPSTLAWQRA